VVRSVAWVGCALVAGCNGGKDADGDSGGFPRGCDESTLDGHCILFTGESWVEQDVIDTCSDGQLVQDCPQTTDLGTCTLEAGTEFETVSTFYTPYWTVATAAAQCETNGGSWATAR
jgi:hypothetical protein